MKCGFIGIGVQKGASTWVYKILEDHFDVVVSFPKELNFFSDDVVFAKGSDWYHSFFKNKKKGNVLYGEISPSYFHNNEAPKRAFDYNNELKIVVTLRDPIERIYSNYLHWIRRNVPECHGKDKSFEAVLANSIERSKGMPELIHQSYYYKHLKKWFEVFPRENILVLIKEDIESNPFINAQKLYKFLSIDESHMSKSLYKKPNASTLVKNNLFESQIRKCSQMAINIGLGSVVKGIKNNSFVMKLREDGKTHLTDVVPAMKEETKQMLMDDLSEDMVMLARLLELESLPWKSWEYAVTKKIT